MEKFLDTFRSIFHTIYQSIYDVFAGLPEDGGAAYEAVIRFVFVFLALFIVIKSIVSLLSTRSPAEVWAYFHTEEQNTPITHWENLIGRSKNADLFLNDPAVSRSHGTLSRDNAGQWSYMDLGSSNGSLVNGKRLAGGETAALEPGDEVQIGKSIFTLFPTSIEERVNNRRIRKEETFLAAPWLSFLALSLFLLLTLIQLRIALAEDFPGQIAVAFFGMVILLWAYVIPLRLLGRKGFEAEILAFFLSSLSLAVTASKYPSATFKQFLAILLGVLLFTLMCTILRNLERAKALRKYIYILAALVLLINLFFGMTLYGAHNWIRLGSITVQPSEIVKMAYVWVGAASLDELMEKKNSLIFTLFSGFCFICLALMGDFGTASIFFVTFLVISFLRSGDFTKLILIVGVAFAGGLLVLKFKGYIADRFSAWGKVWEFADSSGFQQTRTMSASASGGLLGAGAGEGWLKNVPASETDLVFGFITEEWGLIIAILAVVCIMIFSVFAVRSIWGGRSTYYTIAACAAMSLFLFQTMLNVFGSVDIFPLTGVTFPFLSQGGTSMVASWGLLAFLKAADTRQGASIAVPEGGDL